MVLDRDIQNLQGIMQLFVFEKLLEKTKALEYIHQAAIENLSVLQYLMKYQILSSQRIAKTVSRHFGLPLLDLHCINPESFPLDLIDEQLIRKHAILPLYKRNNNLFIVTDDPTKACAFQDIQFHTGLRVHAIVVQTNALFSCMDRLLSNKEQNAYKTRDLSPLEQNPSPTVQFVNQILEDAIKQGISDIHFEPYDNSYRIRYRQDGLLRQVAQPDASMSLQITARIKIMADLDITEKRLPQDGGFKMKLSNSQSLDFRVSTCPTIGGEKIVVRVLDPNSAKLGIEALGFNPRQQELFMKALKRPQGMILVTGPTGSGKTMTLYTALNILNAMEVNISSVEDPVEMKLHGINQVTINPKAGLSFASILRAFLRQDPDILMVGEIRDSETAEIAIQAASTGHLVLSSLHTNSAAETINRLLHMGVDAYNLASSLSLIVAQRLARKLCEFCKIVRDDLSHQHLSALGFTDKKLKLYQAMSCVHCNQGYQGRIGLFEVLPISPRLRELIFSRKSAAELHKSAQNEGMLSLYQSGLEKISSGLSSIEEIHRVSMDSLL